MATHRRNAGAVLVGLAVVSLGGRAGAQQLPLPQPLRLWVGVGRTEGFGPRALGMGGAFLAVADDATASSWNPAGLGQLADTQVQLGGSYRSRKISRGFEGHQALLLGEAVLSDTQLREFSKATSSSVEPDFFTFATPFKLARGRLVLAASGVRERSYEEDYALVNRATTPLAGTYQGQFRTETTIGRQETALRHGGEFQSYSVSLAYNPNDVFLVGLSAVYVDGSERLRQSATMDDLQLTVFQDEAPVFASSWAGVTAANSWDSSFSGWYGVLGVLWRLSPAWTLGASYRSGAKLDYSYNVSESWHSTVEPLIVAGDVRSFANIIGSGRTTLDWPSTLGAGLAFRPRPNWTLSFDVSQSDWTDTSVEVTGEGGTKVTYLYPSLRRAGESYGGRQWRDRAYHLGTEIIVPLGGMWIPLRAGVFYENAASGLPGQRQPTVTGYSAGLGVVARNVYLDLAVLYDTTTVDIDTPAEFQGATAVPWFPAQTMDGLLYLTEIDNLAGGRYSSTSWRVVAALGLRF